MGASPSQKVEGDGGIYTIICCPLLVLVTSEKRQRPFIRVGGALEFEVSGDQALITRKEQL